MAYRDEYLQKSRDVHMHMADIVEFVAALRAEWPTIRFVEYNYAEHLYNEELRAERREDYTSGWRYFGEPRYLVPRDEWYLTLHYGPTSARAALYRAWVLPDESWQPEWAVTEGRYERGIPIVVNQPRLNFVFDRGRYFSSKTRRPADQPPIILDDDEWVEFEGGSIAGVYQRDDTEHRVFLDKVLRIAGKMTSNKHVALDRETGEIKQVVEKGGYTWSARHLRAWAEAHPRHFISGNLKPLRDTIDDGMFWWLEEGGDTRRF